MDVSSKAFNIYGLKISNRCAGTGNSYAFPVF